MADFTKVIVNLPNEQVAFLQAVAAHEHIGVDAVLTRAINLERFFIESQVARRKILVEDSTGLREVVRK